MSANTKEKNNKNPVEKNLDKNPDKNVAEQHKLRKEKLQNLREGSYPFPNDVKIDISCIEFRKKIEQAAAEQNTTEQAAIKKYTV